MFKIHRKLSKITPYNIYITVYKWDCEIVKISIGCLKKSKNVLRGLNNNYTENCLSTFMYSNIFTIF